MHGAELLGHRAGRGKGESLRGGQGGAGQSKGKTHGAGRGVAGQKSA